MKLVLGLFLLLLLSACGKKVTESQDPVVSPQTANEGILDLVNDYRSQLGLSPLIDQEVIQEVAITHSKDMAGRRSPYGHSGLVLRCKKIREELRMGNDCSEIVFRGVGDVSDLFRSIRAIPELRQKIEGDYTHAGAGMAESDKGVVYWTILFLNTN